MHLSTQLPQMQNISLCSTMYAKSLSFAKIYWPHISSLLLTISVVVTQNFHQKSLVLAIVMLVLPLYDDKRHLLNIVITKTNVLLFFALLAIMVVVISLKPDLLFFYISTLVFAALPEEWFFRAYLMQRIGRGIKANIITSIFFAALHAITFSWIFSFLVFFPSLVFGWLYQWQQNFVTLVLLHSVSNLIYVAYLYQYFETFS